MKFEKKPEIPHIQIHRYIQFDQSDCRTIHKQCSRYKRTVEKTY